jgi:hypothetical protein
MYPEKIAMWVLGGILALTGITLLLYPFLGVDWTQLGPLRTVVAMIGTCVSIAVGLVLTVLSCIILARSRDSMNLGNRVIKTYEKINPDEKV